MGYAPCKACPLRNALTSFADNPDLSLQKLSSVRREEYAARSS